MAATRALDVAFKTMLLGQLMNVGATVSAMKLQLLTTTTYVFVVDALNSVPMRFAVSVLVPLTIVATMDNANVSTLDDPDTFESVTVMVYVLNATELE